VSAVSIVCERILDAMAALVRLHSAGMIFDDEFTEIMKRLDEALRLANELRRRMELKARREMQRVRV